jgi:hypothetical protein
MLASSPSSVVVSVPTRVPSSLLPDLNPWTLAVVLLGYLVLLATSSAVVEYFLKHWTGTDISTSITDEQRDTGKVIGKCENVLVLTLIVANAYTALGLIFAAKSIVRKEDMSSDDTTYYLAGTLLNFTYSVVSWSRLPRRCDSNSVSSVGAV